MATTDGKALYRQMVESVREKRRKLSSDSPIREAVTDELLHRLVDHIEQTSTQDLTYGYWPPVFGLVDSLSAQRLDELDADFHLVIETSDSKKRKELVSFLHARARDKTGPWYGGLFDIWAKATAIRSGFLTELDALLPNRRDHDITLTMGGRRFHLENTVITQDDESCEVWDRFLQDKRQDPGKVLIRPGAYCPTDAKGPSPYYDALRLYAKVYDKLAKNLNPNKSQCVDGEPNLLLISFSGPGVRADSPSVGWVLDELFADQPKMVHTIAPDGFTDISLDAWIDFTARELIAREKITVDFYCDRSNEIMAAPRNLGGVLLFDGASYAGSRVNYNANEGSVISHREIAQIEDIFASSPSWWF